MKPIFGAHAPPDALDVLTISTADVHGGAARAAYRVHRGLVDEGVSARMLVQRKYGDDPTVALLHEGSRLGRAWAAAKPRLDAIPVRLYPDRQAEHWSCNFVNEPGFAGAVARLSPGIVHLHWIGEGFLSPAQIGQLKRPVVWTLHDMWPFTGGCHYDRDCGRYRTGCGMCPQLRSSHAFDLSRAGWLGKKRGLGRRKLAVVCPSRWLAACARESELLRGFDVHVIPNGLDMHQFKPLDKRLCRQTLGIASDRTVIAFGAVAATSDPRKGFDLLAPALRQLSARRRGGETELLIFGAGAPAEQQNFGLPCRHLGKLQDDISLAVVYSAADLVVVPSRQENLSNVVAESMACGTPVVAYDVGGMADMIVHQVNGYLAPPYSEDDLAHGMAWVLETDERRRALAESARERAVANWALPLTIARYRELYASLHDSIAS